MVTISVSDQELADLQELLNQSDPAQAVRTAMRDYVRYLRRVQLKNLSGKVEMQDNWRELEAAETEPANGDEQ